MTVTATFDVLLGCLFPAALLLVAYQFRGQLFSSTDIYNILFPGSSASPPSNAYYALDRAYFSYLQYLNLSYNDVKRMRVSYASLGRAHKSLGYKLGYPQKLERFWEATSLNAMLTEEIADLASKQFPELKDIAKAHATPADLARVRESLKHFVRDWSSAGATERQKTLAPVLDLLRLVPLEERASRRILLPGSGLGRLAWEISQLGFHTTANELSFFMTLAFRYLLSPETTQQIDQHKIRPFAHWFSHQRRTDNLFRAVSFPDALPRLSPTFHLLEQDFLKLKLPKSKASSDTPTPKPDFWSTESSPSQPGPSTSEPNMVDDAIPHDGFDYIVTLFFIDTSFNVFATMEQIYALLKPGGSWVNLGPLLWPGGGQCKLELSLEELLLAAEDIGFVLERYEDGGHPEAQKTVECEYTADPEAMMRWTYKTEFWVAKKPL